MQPDMFLLKEDGFGPVYLRRDALGSIRVIPQNLREAGRPDMQVEIRYLSGTRDWITDADWERIKPYLVADDTDLRAALMIAIEEGVTLAQKLAKAEARIKEQEHNIMHAKADILELMNRLKERGFAALATSTFFSQPISDEQLAEAHESMKAYVASRLKSADEGEWYYIDGMGVPRCRNCNAETVYCVCGVRTSFGKYPRARINEEAFEKALRSDMAEIMQQPADTPPPPQTPAPVDEWSGAADSLRELADEQAAKQVDNTAVRIIKVECADFHSTTSNSRRPMWRMTTDSGCTVNAFDHADPLRDHKPMLEKAGYLAQFQGMAKGDAAHWTTSPIRAQIEPDGSFWKLLSIEKRGLLQIPDRVSNIRLDIAYEAAELLKLDDLRVFDLETTGLGDDDEIVEIAVFAADGDETLEPVFASLIRPQDMTKLRRVGKKGKTAVQIHGITEDMLADAPPLDDAPVLNQISEELDKRIWAAFGMDFDERMLLQNMELIGDNSGFPAPRKTVCVMEMMKRYTGRKFISLDDACELLMIGRTGGRHRATADALDTLLVLKALAAQIPLDTPVAESADEPPF